MVGTKADRKDELNVGGQGPPPITREQGEALAREINAVGYVETSAKTGQGIMEAIDLAVKAAMTPDPEPIETSWCCCLI